MKFIDPSNVKPMKVVVDGGNGMAGPMVGPLLERAPARPRRDVLDARRQVPRPRAQPAARGEPPVHRRQGPAEGADLGIAWDGDADRCFFIDDTGRFVDGDFLTAILAEHLLGKQPGSAILYDVRASRAVPDIVARGRRHAPTPTASATRSSRPACATRARSSAARSPATTTSTTSTTPTPARSRRC